MSRIFIWTSDAVRDLRIAVRGVPRDPLFTITVVVTLALGIGVTTAVFGVAEALLLHPLPYPHSERLVRILESAPAEETASGVPEVRAQMNIEEFAEWRVRTRTLSHMAVYTSRQRTLVTTAGAIRVSAAQVSPALFGMLQIRPRLGRTLEPGDERADSDAVVLGGSLWRAQFASTADIVGMRITLDGQIYRVVGVLPEAFDFPTPKTGIWTAYIVTARAEGQSTYVDVMARLADGVTLEVATAEANVIAEGLRRRTGRPARAGQTTFALQRVQDHLVAPVVPAMRALTVSAGLVFLIVCANVANLLLARGMLRTQEMAIRRALGAERARVVRQLLVEGVALSTIGGTAGLVLAAWVIAALRRLASADVPELFQLADRARFGSSAIIPRLEGITSGMGVVPFAAAISLLTGLLVGGVPALQISENGRQSLNSGHWSASTRTRSTVRSALVVGQIAVATVLLLSAGLLVHSFVNLTNVSTGYNPHGVVTFQLALPIEYPLEQKSRIAHELVSRLRALPRVDAVGFTNLPPLAGGVLAFGIFVPPGRTSGEMMRDPGQPQARAVTSDYLHALGVRLITGRWLDEGDVAGGRQVLLVNRALVRRYFQARDPVGSEVHLLPSPTPWEVVGVVDDVRQGKPNEEPVPQFFVAPRQALVAMSHLPVHIREGAALGFLSFAVHATGDSAAIWPEVRAVVHQLDPTAAVEGDTTMDRLLANSMSRQRLLMVLLSGFALIAASLGAVGIYGVLAHSVAQRTKEIGVRMALGASSGQILWPIMVHGAGLTGLGLAGGVLSAIMWTRVLQGMLFGVTSVDPFSYLAVVIGFGLVATVASYVPGRRATTVDPLVAIRHE